MTILFRFFGFLGPKDFLKNDLTFQSFDWTYLMMVIPKRCHLHSIIYMYWYLSFYFIWKIPRHKLNIQLNWFNPSTLLFLSQARTWISWSFCVQWVQLRWEVIDCWLKPLLILVKLITATVWLKWNIHSDYMISNCNKFLLKSL